MSLDHPLRANLYLEPLEERWLLSLAPLPVPPSGVSAVSTQYAILPAEQTPKNTAQPAANQLASLDDSVAPVSPTAVLAVVPVGPAIDRERDEYVLIRDDIHPGDTGEGLHADGLALVRTLADHSTQQTGEPTRAAAQTPGLPPAPLALVGALVPADAHPAPRRLAEQPAAMLDALVAEAAEQSDKAAPVPLVLVNTGGCGAPVSVPKRLPIALACTKAAYAACCAGWLASWRWKMSNDE